jgi:hypothetical protein
VKQAQVVPKEHISAFQVKNKCVFLGEKLDHVKSFDLLVAQLWNVLAARRSRRTQQRPPRKRKYNLSGLQVDQRSCLVRRILSKTTILSVLASLRDETITCVSKTQSLSANARTRSGRALWS